MRYFISLGFKAFRKILWSIITPLYTLCAKTAFYLNNIKIPEGLQVKGPLNVYVTRRGKAEIGNYLKINSGNNFNIIGRQQRATFWVEGSLKIGDNVGISATSIICHHQITIGNNVIIGGNTVIYDTDFHSIDYKSRLNGKDKENTKKLPVYIHDNVFIGAHTTILKGVTIGENSVIGACSVVTKSIPSNEVWAGNPVRFIKKIS